MRSSSPKKNRYAALSALNKEGLQFNGEQEPMLVNMVTGMVKVESAEDINQNVKTLVSLVNELSKAKVQEAFKSAGRIPGGGQQNNDENTDNSVAKRLGVEKAAQAKKTNEVLKYYIGG